MIQALNPWHWYKPLTRATDTHKKKPLQLAGAFFNNNNGNKEALWKQHRVNQKIKGSFWEFTANDNLVLVNKKSPCEPSL